MEPKEVGARVAALIAALDIDQKVFAESIDLDPSSLTKIIKGNKPLQPYMAYKIHQRHGVDLNYIYLGQFSGLPLSLSNTITKHLNGQKL